MLVLALVFGLTVFFQLFIQVTPVYAATKTDDQLKSIINDKGYCSNFADKQNQCVSAFIEVYKDRKKVSNASGNVDSNAGGLAEKFCISKSLDTGLCIGNIVSQAFELSKGDKVGDGNDGGSGGSGSGNSGDKIVSNPPKAVSDEADSVCKSENKDTAKKGETPDCRSAYIYAFMNNDKFLKGDGTVDLDYIRNQYCTGGGRTVEECQKGASQGSLRGKQLDGDPDKLASATGAAPKDQVDCDMKLESILSWIACPVIDMGVNTTDWVFEKMVQPMLENVPVSTNPDDGSFKAWQQFRLIANILLVGSLLAIVYSQAKGGGR